MPKASKRSIRVELRCTDLPDPHWGGRSATWIGIQQGAEVVQEVQLPADHVQFEVELQISDGPSGAPNFLGAYAHGTVQERFLYLCWGQRVLGSWVGFRRAKLPLSKLTWDDLASGVLVATVHCTDAKGGPVCATLKDDHLTWSAG